MSFRDFSPTAPPVSPRDAAIDGLVAENRSLELDIQRLVDDARHNAEVLARAHEREKALVGAPDLGALIDELTIGLERSFDVTAVRLTLFDPFDVVADLLRDVAPSPEALARLRLVGGWKSIRARYPGLEKPWRPWLGPVRQPWVRRLFTGQAVASAALVPLRSDDGLAGVVNLGSADPARFTRELGTAFLGQLGELGALCLENAVNRARLRRSGLTDGLTGLYNRRHLQHRLEQEVARARRHRHPLSCLFIDADRFKAINDTHGHAAGDRVLMVLAGIVERCLRNSDLATRYGGEEFAVLLPQVGLRAAASLAERIRATVADAAIELEDGSKISVTVSIGVAEIGRLQDPSPHPGDALLAAADAAVYKAKQSGRNKISVSECSH